MKKITTSNSGVAIYCLLAMTLILTACQKDEMTDKNNNSQKTFSLLRTGDCESDCIAPDGPYFDIQDSKMVYWGGRTNTSNSKKVDIKYYNTETHFVMEVKSTNNWSDLVINGVSSWTGGPVAAGTWGVYSVPLDSGWQACDMINFTLAVTGNGPPASFDVEYKLIGICYDGCESSFTGEALSCGSTREAIYTFTADADQDYIKIQGGLTNFTGEDAVVTVSGGNLSVTQSTPGGGSNRIIKVEGSVSECEVIIVHVIWNSTNSGSVITGSWSVKDDGGIELAPAVPGLSCN
nr:hypothetical protein [uncultured Flavobacterium sp.]